jgi:uncharacterized protein
MVLVWHSLFGYPKIISVETLKLIESFSEPMTLRSRLGSKVIKGNQDAIDLLINCFILVPEGFDDRAFLRDRLIERDAEIANGSLIDYLEHIMSEACNFRCTYCIHFNNLEISDRINEPNKFMRFETARETVDQYLRILSEHGKRVANINFGGGEPLMAWPVIEETIEYCKEKYNSEFDFIFSINTNASLITPEIASSLKKHNVDVASSLDGLQEGNDRVRLTKSGKGTFSQITHGFEELDKVGYPIEGFSVTVIEKNFYELDESIIDWAIARNMNSVRIDIDVIDMVEIPIDVIIEKLMRIRRYAKDKGVDVPGFWLRPAENFNESILENHVAFCGATRGNSMCVSPSGNIYSCGYSTSQIGSLPNIDSFYTPDSPYYHFVIDRRIGELERCNGCEIEGQCGGGCNIAQEFSQANHMPKTERMCDFYRRITHEILREQLREAVIL